jgi:CheY-like chemotaxis protein
MLKAPYILLGEDSEEDAYFAGRCFKAASIKVDLKRCANGAEVCADLKRSIGHLPLGVILDLKMPVMDGFEALKWIREQPEFATLPVIIMSSSGLEEDRVRAAKLGCTEYLIKPHTIAKLQQLFVSLVERLLARTATAAVQATGTHSKTRRLH